LDVSDISTDLDVYSVSTNSVIIPPATTEEIYITFSPTEELVYSDTVMITAETPFGSFFSVELSGQGVIPVNAGEILPLITEVFQNYPNPFNPETTIKYSLTESGIPASSIATFG